MSFTIKCSGCGAELEAEDDWVGMETECPSCNSAIVIEKPEEPSQEMPVPQTVDSSQENPSLEEPVNNEKGSQQNKVYEKKKSKKGLILGILGGIILVILLLCFFLLPTEFDLEKAIRKNDLRSTKLLLMYGANPNKKISNREYRRWRPLGVIGDSDSPGSVFNDRSNEKRLSASDFQSFKEKRDNLFQIADALIANGADINADNGKILYDAVASDQIYFVEYLLKKGADVNLKNADGNTPVSRAVRKPKILKLLMDNGADLSIKNNKGEDLLWLKERKQNQKITANAKTNCETTVNGWLTALKNGESGDKYWASQLMQTELFAVRSWRILDGEKDYNAHINTVTVQIDSSTKGGFRITKNWDLALIYDEGKWKIQSLTEK